MNSHGVTRLRLLGAPAIEGPAVDGAAVLKQPKRLLLLAYLATRNGFVTRDTLLGLFWPTLGEDRARHALSQAIHFLRSTLGKRWIVTRGSTEIAIGIDVRCDVVEFEKEVKSESWEAALELYEGDLLSGVIPPRTRELGLWLESERVKLRRQATTAATTLSNAAYQEDDLAGAINWSRRTLAITPFEESAHRNYLALLDEAGNAPGAIAAHEMFRARLHELYDLEPAPETVRVVDLIRSRQSKGGGSGDAAPAGADAVAPEAATTIEATNTPETEAFRKDSVFHRRWQERPQPGTRKTRKRVRIGTLAALPVFVAIVANLFWGISRGEDSLPLVHNRVAVLYLEVNGDQEELRYIADGMTEALIGFLGQASNLDVVSANGVRMFRGRTPPTDTVTARLRAKTIILGTVAEFGGNTRVTLEVIDGESGAQYNQFTVQSASNDVLRMIDEVIEEAGNHLGPILGEVVALGRWRAGTDNPVALDHLLKAGEARKNAEKAAGDNLLDLAREAYEAADALLELAARLDPDWTEPHIQRGHIALGRAYLCMGDPECQDAVPLSLDRAAEYAQRALEVKKLDAGALELLGRAHLQKWSTTKEPAPTWFVTADSALGGAVTLDPTRAGAWADLSAVHFALADFDRSETAAKRALEEDAFLKNRTEILVRLFQSTFHGGHDFEAARWCDGVRAQIRGHWLGAECLLNLMAWSRLREAHPDSAWFELDRSLLHESPEAAAFLRPRLELLVAAVLAEARMADSARAVIDRARSSSVEDPDLLYYAAAAYMALGELEKAREHLSAFLDGGKGNGGHVASYRWFEELNAESPLPAVRSPG